MCTKACLKRQWCLTGRPCRLSKYSKHFCRVIFSRAICPCVISCGQQKYAVGWRSITSRGAHNHTSRQTLDREAGAADINHIYCTPRAPWQRINKEAINRRWAQKAALAHQHVLREAEGLALLLESLQQRVHRLLQSRPLLLLMWLLLSLQRPLVVMSGPATAAAVFPPAALRVGQILHRLLQPQLCR